ncbi:hypothetical protein [Ornithinibacillus xuwenensis]|uniref:Competence protein ComGG n=1 Tax=Ornithinibacillus xuwenensis TaxID=3144668 RepID=A0ABU9XCK7_9BACI
MKKSLSIIRNQKGITFPSVLLLTSLVLLHLSFSIISFSHDIRITANHMEQIKAQTLFQIGYERYEEEFLQKKDFRSTTYESPDGVNHINISQMADNTLLLHFNIVTNEDYHYTVTKKLNLATKSHN